MITKQMSVALSIAAGLWMGATLAYFVSRVGASIPVILLDWPYLFPLLVPATNMAYQDNLLPKVTSVVQLVFFAACFANGAGLLLGAPAIVSSLAIGLAVVAAIALAIMAVRERIRRRRGEEKGVKNPRKTTIKVLAILTTIWLPVSLFVNPGWGTLMIFTPYVLIMFAPLVVILAANSSDARKKVFPTSVFIWEALFCLLVASLGVLYVNGGDAEVHSTLSRSLSGIRSESDLIQLTPLLMGIVISLIIALLPIVFAYRRHEDRKWRVVPVALSVGIALAGLYVLFGGYQQKTDTLKKAAASIEQDVINPAGGKQLFYQQAGDGLLTVRWAVPVDNKKEWDFIWTLTQKEGYVSMDPVFPCDASAVPKGGDCSTWGVKKGSELHIKIRPATQQEIPKDDVSPKIWRVVEVQITPYSYAPDRTGEVHPQLDSSN